jgi:hypothetical protein
VITPRADQRAAGYGYDDHGEVAPVDLPEVSEAHDHQSRASARLAGFGVLNRGRGEDRSALLRLL